MTERIAIRFLGLAVAVCLLLSLGGARGWAQQTGESFQAIAHGGGNQAGMTIGLTINIKSFSTADDGQELWKAFDKAGNQGLADALVKVPARGHLSFSGVAEYEIAYARIIPTAKGRMIRIVARRPLRFGEDPGSLPSATYRLSALELDLIGSSGTGTFLPVCELSVGQGKEVEIVTYQDAWRLDGISGQPIP